MLSRAAVARNDFAVAAIAPAPAAESAPSRAGRPVVEWGMAGLVLADEIGQSFLGALYAVCRADGEVCEAEVDALRAIATEMAIAVDEQTLFFSEVTPASFARAVRGDGGGPFRATESSPPAAIRAAFVEAAERVARADGMFNDNEQKLIDAFVRALLFT